eukprot:gnl/MRDRNA2_/MRDRNA2_61729_c0_seq1.p1 gnl/MRDRNA2_/MRDRNA2_61729_c0~~gnl/MRDRNA2_/MRDRNA2_61729_c0_seq1.p1  ORF type:complete len:732 (+),score=181.78 gnl/MRDRNA2_/MRDRNA2_61729_c0_seq1:77-2272(+)
MSWLNRVGDWARDAARDASRALPSSRRAADDAQAELEQQAHKLGDPTAAVELLTRWVELADSNRDTFTLGDQKLSFSQVFVRSRALELCLAACSANALLRAELNSTGEEETALAFALRSLAERFLLPEAMFLWPVIVEMLLTAGPLPRWSKPAVRVLTALKRDWRVDAMLQGVRRLERDMDRLATRAPAASSSSQPGGAALRSGTRLSKKAIQLALAQERLQQTTKEAQSLQSRAELLMEMCEQLEKSLSCGGNAAATMEGLISESDIALTALDQEVKGCSADQDDLGESMNAVSGEIQSQIAGMRMTMESFNTKRKALHEERANLVRRLEEIDGELAELGRVADDFRERERQLRSQFRETTGLFEDRIAGRFCDQRHLADEKLAAVSMKACAYQALDVIHEQERTRSIELSNQLRQKRSQLARACTGSVQQARLRLEAAMECSRSQVLQAEGSSAKDGDIGDEVMMAIAAVKEAWQDVQKLLQRAFPLLRGTSNAVLTEEGDKAANEVDPGKFSPPPRNIAKGSDSDMKAKDAEASNAKVLEAKDIFENRPESDRTCIDCKDTSEAEWASLSHGTYLCLECAGKHRGLGVHVSFVRSTTMDAWDSMQLKRMQLGGNQQFREFVASCPGLEHLPFEARHNSRGLEFYRRRLDHLCEGGSSDDMEPPSANDALKAMQPRTGKAAGTSDKQPQDHQVESSNSELEELEEAQKDLQETYLEYQKQLSDALAKKI